MNTTKKRDTRVQFALYCLSAILFSILLPILAMSIFFTKVTMWLDMAIDFCINSTKP